MKKDLDDERKLELPENVRRMWEKLQIRNAAVNNLTGHAAA